MALSDKQGRNYSVIVLSGSNDASIRLWSVERSVASAANTEVFVSASLNRHDLAEMLTSLRAWLRAIESYPTSTGYLCRLPGPHELIDAIMRLPPDVRERREYQQTADRGHRV